MARRGWHKDSYRHYLAAKGIKTTYYAKSPYSKVSVEDINRANEVLLQVKARNSKMLDAAKELGEQELARQNLGIVGRRHRKMFNYILKEDAAGRYVTREELVRMFGPGAKSSIFALEKEGHIERTTPEGHTWRLKEE